VHVVEFDMVYTLLCIFLSTWLFLADFLLFIVDHNIFVPSGWRGSIVYIALHGVSTFWSWWCWWDCYSNT